MYENRDLSMSAKKDLAIILGSTGNMAFAVANVVMGLKKHCKLNFDLIIYCDEKFSEKDKNLISEIKTSNFINYKYFEESKEKFDSNTINRFTNLAFSRYECFRLLDKYKKTVWLDTDLLIKKDISELINIDDNDMALYVRKGIIKNEFLKPVPIKNCDIEAKSYNSGVIVFYDTIKNRNEIADWCYEKTIEFAEYLKCPDQAIINIAMQVFNLNVKTIDVKYNCHPEYKESSKAAILHPYSMEKFWNYYSDKEWDNNYKNWLKMGGSAYTGKKYNLLEKVPVYIKKKFFPEAPDPFRHTRKFILYMIKKKFK